MLCTSFKRLGHKVVSAGDQKWEIYIGRKFPMTSFTEPTVQHLDTKKGRNTERIKFKWKI